MRWEMRTRPFLRTSEFLWQEGHTAHATREEAEKEAQLMLKVYAEFAEKWMAVPVMQGVKSETERFAGALDTYTIEAMMQDGKALQSGTSHFLGQNFAKAFDVTYLNKENKPEYVWATSWGVSTRLIGALIMTHSDDNGLVLPPRLAPIQVVIIPIGKADQIAAVSEAMKPVIDSLRQLGISVKFDDSDNKRPGFKFADYELKGVPVRLVMGGRDLENGTVEVMRRDTLEKETVPFEGIVDYVKNLLDDIQDNIFEKARSFRDAHIYECDDYEEFKQRVVESGFNYDPVTEKTLGELEKLAKFEGYYDDAKDEFEALRKKLKHNVAKDMDHSKETIKQIIEGDIVAAYYYQAGALENGLHYDSQVKKATEVLLDKSEYDRLLSPKGK